MVYTIILLLVNYFATTTSAQEPTCTAHETPPISHAHLLTAARLAYTCHGQTDVYSIRPSPGKGLGVYALRDLEVGTVIMRESPILKILPPEYEKGSGYPMAAISQLLRAAFVHLTPQEQDEVMSLGYYGTEEQKNRSDPLALIFKTNAYKSGDEIGLFPKIARINHSCRPNTSYFWDTRSNKRVMYANRKIKEGEEILDSYISLLQSQERRQKHLNPYGFTCTCDACAAKKRSKKESDARRLKIRRAFSSFDPHLRFDAPKKTREKQRAERDAKASEELVEIVHQEELADYYATAYKIAAISHARAGNWQSATVWANKGYEWRVMEDPQSSYAMEMHNLTATFIEHWKADLRSKNLLTKEV